MVERGPGAAYHMFVVMEDLVEKLKLLRYEEELLRKSNLKPPSRWVPSSRAGWALGRCLPRACWERNLASIFLAREGRFIRNSARAALELSESPSSDFPDLVEKVNKLWKGRGLGDNLLIL